jgi:CheY-like chemotaxis protein
VAEEGGAQVLGSVDLMNKPVARDELQRMLNRNLTAGAARVLVVQDKAEDRLVLERYLRDAGLQVAMAEGASHALALLQRTPVDLVLLDLTLPETDGIRLLEQIRDLPDLVSLPVVMLASRDLSPDEADLLSRHGVRVIQKGTQVERHLRRALDQRFNRERGVR